MRLHVAAATARPAAYEVRRPAVRAAVCRRRRVAATPGIGGGGGRAAALAAAAALLPHLLLFLLLPLVFGAAVLEPHFHLKEVLHFWLFDYLYVLKRFGIPNGLIN